MIALLLAALCVAAEGGPRAFEDYDPPEKTRTTFRPSVDGEWLAWVQTDEERKVLYASPIEDREAGTVLWDPETHGVGYTE